jgi:uncharacterized delta-60 repeat protein
MPRIRTWFVTLTLTSIVATACGGGGGAGGPDLTPPRITATIPPNGATDFLPGFAISAVFDEELSPTSVDETKLTLTDEHGVTIPCTASCGQRTASFLPLEDLDWSTHFTAVLHAGLCDRMGNFTLVEHTWGFRTIANPDHTPPAVVATEPLDGASGVPLDALVHAWFSEALDPATLDTASFLLVDSGGAPIAGSVEASGFVATFTPAVPLAPNELHTATITSAARDLAGNALAAPYSWTFESVIPPAGTLDSSFGAAGVVRTSLSDNNDWVNGMVVQSDGKIVVGALTNAGLTSALARYLPDGSLDPAFGFGGSFGTIVEIMALAQQPDHKLVAAGGVWSGTLRFAIARYDSGGGADAGFGVNGLVLTPISAGDDVARELALQPDGKILALGAANNSLPVLVRYQSNGALDALFGNAGILTLPLASASCLGLQADGKIVVGGQANPPAGHIAVVRLDASGALDSSFGVDGYVSANLGGFYGDWVAALVVQPDGKIVLAGGVGTASGTDSVLLRCSASGALDPGFGDLGVRILQASTQNDAFAALALQPDGKLLAAGQADSGGFDFLLARFSTSGALDAGFGSAGLAQSDLGSSFDEGFVLARDLQGRILVAGRTLGVTGYDVALARYWP